MYFVTNDIANDTKKGAILLSVCGPTTYQLIHNLAQSKKPSDLSYVELVQLLSMVTDELDQFNITTADRNQFQRSILVSDPAADTLVRLSCCRHPGETVTS